MEDPKKNKVMRPEETKGPEAPKEPSVRIRFRAGRAAEGVQANENGEAVVEAGLAKYLVSIGYADEIVEKEN